MRGGNLQRAAVTALFLTAAACGGKDKGGDKNATANTGTATTANTSVNAEAEAAAAAAAIAAKIKDFNDQNGGCPECKADEARVIAAMAVPHGLRTYTATPSCMNEVHDTAQIREVTDDAAGLSDGQFAGAAVELLKSPAVKKLLAQQVGGDVGRVLNGGDDKTAYCQAVCAVLPKDSTIKGYKLEAANATDGQYQTCAAGTDCAIGKSKWTSEPSPSTGDNSKQVCAVFANWAHKTNRLARLSVYFTPPADWAPPHR